YWMRPSLADLRAMSTQQLRAVKNFTVGRTGVGQVSFGKPVDLTTVGSLSAIAGGVVLFDDRVCTVYPDESNKPPRGQGLNVPAIISLHDCWPIDRSTGEAIVHMDDPRVRKHIRRLRKIEETEFIDFVNGTWIFKVEHF
ncbi:nucleoporin autopeptidase-domain-containing protein, partial [Coemansia spiralis]